MMEKICSWFWRPELNGKQREDSFWWDEESGRVFIKRGGILSGEYYDGAWMLDKLGRKEYGKLMLHMKNTFDFLTAKLGGA